MFDIEVRWPSEPFLWRRAQLWDLTKEGVVCSFKDGSFKETFFPFEDARFLSTWDGDPSFFPETGDLVEYELLPTDLESSSRWAVAKVSSHSECLWHLRWPERSEFVGEVLMPLSRLRPSESKKIEGLQKEEMRVDSSLLSADASTCFRRVESLAIGLQNQKDTPELLRIRQVGAEAVVAVGTSKAVQRAKLLIPSMLHHQKKAKVLKDASKKREDALTTRSMKKIREGWNREATLPDGVVKGEFRLDSYNVGRFIGKGGSNIRALQNDLNVCISVTDEADHKKVVVIGPSQEAVERVRKSSEILTWRFPCADPLIRKWLVWRSHVLDTIKKMCSLVSIQLVSDAVVFAGNQEACEHAVKFLEAQIKYFPTLQSLDLARNDLEQQLGEDRGDRDVVWPHRVEVRPERRSSSVERRSSGVPQPTPRLPRARSEPRRNAPIKTQKVWF